MGKRRTKNTQPASDSPYAAGNAAAAVLERRRHGSKSAQLDWIRLVNGQRLGESIPPAVVSEVAEDCDIPGDSWTLLHTDAQDLSNYLRHKNYTDKVPSFIEEHGTMESLCKKEKELKAQLEDVQKLIRDLRTNKQIDSTVNGPALAALNHNKRLFPDRNENLLQEAGVT